MNSPVQKIKEKLSIEEVVSSYIKLEKAGANLKAKCPFHNEKNDYYCVNYPKNPIVIYFHQTQKNQVNQILSTFKLTK